MKYKLYKLSLISICYFLLGFTQLNLPVNHSLLKQGRLWIEKRVPASPAALPVNDGSLAPVIAAPNPAPIPAPVPRSRPRLASVKEESFAPEAVESRLVKFIEMVKDERKKGLIVGVFVANTFANPVVQQPANNLLYVSTKENTLTQFRRATQAGTIGLLAHNYLAGAHFFNLKAGSQVYLINWDGSYRLYEVYAIEDYQAVTLTSFRDLSTGKGVGQYTLFDRIYRSKNDRLVFQTCIRRNGSSSWGRRFILAKPVAEQG
jgi:hypothetical protein